MNSINKQERLAVLSLSGGMDSTSLLIRLLAEGYSQVYCITFDYNQKHRIEIRKAEDNIRYLSLFKDLEERLVHRNVNLQSAMACFESSLTQHDQNIPEGHYAEDNMKSTVVPNRNAIFSSIIYGYALSLYKVEGKDVDICLGIHAGDHAIYPDCTPQFRDQLELAFKVGNYDSEHVSYYTPFIDGNKTSILYDCLQNCDKLDLDFDIVLGNTITSYNPDSKGRSSGKSGSDVERVEAFINIGRKDPIEYSLPWEEVVEHVKEVLNHNERPSILPGT